MQFQIRGVCVLLKKVREREMKEKGVYIYFLIGYFRKKKKESVLVKRNSENRNWLLKK